MSDDCERCKKLEFALRAILPYAENECDSLNEVAKDEADVVQYAKSCEEDLQIAYDVLGITEIEDFVGVMV